MSDTRLSTLVPHFSSYQILTSFVINTEQTQFTKSGLLDIFQVNIFSMSPIHLLPRCFSVCLYEIVKYTVKPGSQNPPSYHVWTYMYGSKECEIPQNDSTKMGFITAIFGISYSLKF